MGKNGKAMRAEKMRTTVYTFTREQLEARDRALEADYQRRFDERLRQVAKEETDRINEQRLQVLPLVMAVPIEVLLDEFGWRPLPGENKWLNPRSRLARFVVACGERLNDLVENMSQEVLDEYCRQVWERSGVRLDRREEE